MSSKAPSTRIRILLHLQTFCSGSKVSAPHISRQESNYSSTCIRIHSSVQDSCLHNVQFSMCSSRFTASLVASLYQCRQKLLVLFFKCIYILSLLHAMCHSKGRMSDCFIWTNNKVKLLLKVCIEYKTSKDKAVFPLGWPPCCFVPNLKHHRQESWTLDECPHASKKYRI